MFLFEAIKVLIFGVVEGITEWLPVSSTGHMLLLDRFMPLSVSADFYGVFEVLIQLGAVLAVAVRYKDVLSPIGKSQAERRGVARLWLVTLIGVLPSAVIGFFLDDIIEERLYSPVIVAIMLVVYGVAFIVAEALMKKRSASVSALSELTPRRGLLIGAFQVLALIPGTSRSGATILGAYICGATRPVAAEFSFLLAIPTMLGAGALRAVKFFAEGHRLSAQEIILLALGTLTAYAISRVSVGFLTDFVRRRGFTAFGVYRIILGGILLFYFLVGRG